MQTPVEYHTVFTFLQKPAESSQEFVMVPVILIVVGVVVGTVTIIRRRAVGRVRSFRLIVVSIFFVIFGAYFLHSVSGVAAWRRDRYDGLKNLYLAGQYSVAEGTVTNFHPMPASGHDYETFSVNGVPFSFSDFDGSPCFNNTASHGGPMREGLRVRLAYSGNCILKLEVAPNH